MDEVVKGESAHLVAFDINPRLNADKIHREFSERGRVRVRNFLNHQAADALYHYLDKEASWRTFAVADEKLMGTAQDDAPVTSEEDVEILRAAIEGARRGIGAAYDATKLFEEDVDDGGNAGNHAPGSILMQYDSFVESETFLTFVRKVIGLQELGKVATQAIRLRPGHFAGLYSSTWSADKTSKRRAVFFLNLTPEWLPERGGLTEFRLRDSDVIEAYVPTFNTLDIVSFPLGWWTSTVSAFAEAPIYMLHGRLYLE